MLSLVANGQHASKVDELSGGLLRQAAGVSSLTEQLRHVEQQQEGLKETLRTLVDFKGAALNNSQAHVLQRRRELLRPLATPASQTRAVLAPSAPPGYLQSEPLAASIERRQPETARARQAAKPTLDTITPPPTSVYDPSSTLPQLPRRKAAWGT